MEEYIGSLYSMFCNTVKIFHGRSIYRTNIPEATNVYKEKSNIHHQARCITTGVNSRNGMSCGRRNPGKCINDWK